MTNLQLTDEQVLFLVKQLQDNNEAWNQLAHDDRNPDRNETTSYGKLKGVTYKKIADISDRIYNKLQHEAGDIVL